ncbi:hypothetical protein JZ751_026336 [Albula glossodonta]|uniref:Carbonic anhydrase n=1 Tax=Albula glossodonta TaxID=121402 RepID=A0A8T2P974_9TELE|nr:hypothetical protein JZ751_026336 [Albula glossodonta]
MSEFTPSHWKDLPDVQCGGHAQSPISIDTSHLTADPNLVDFNFTNFSNNHTLKHFVNTGHTGSQVNISHSIAIDDLLGNVSRSKFYRYRGSLTTPPCSEAVVWTVFQEPIPISEDMVKLFPKTLNHLKVYRPKQDLNGRKVFASPAILPPPGHSWCYDEDCDYKPSRWYQLPHSHCGGDRQSPINIDTNQVMHNKDLNNFTFVNFSNEHSMKYLKNTGHTVKCVLEENMVEIEGGGLNHKYSTLQFHFHWGGEDEHSSGSEHTVNSKRYQMEMHIVSLRKGLTVEQAKVDPEGIAVLGFFIELKKFPTMMGYHNVYRPKQELHKRTIYTSSAPTLPSPTALLLKKFPTMMGYHNVYRPKQELHKRTIYTSSAPTLPSPTALLVLLPLFYPACGWMGAQ